MLGRIWILGTLLNSDNPSSWVAAYGRVFWNPHPLFKLFFKNTNLVYFWLCWVFIAASGFSLVGWVEATHCGAWAAYWGAPLVAEHSLWVPGPWYLWHLAPVVAVHWLSCSLAGGIFPDLESHLCPLHWQADCYPLYHQGSSPPPPVHHLDNPLLFYVSWIQWLSSNT